MFKAADKWSVPYLASILRRPRRSRETTDVMVAFCDHFEPLSPGGTQPKEIGARRVERWQELFPAMAGEFADADGCHPRHTFFYPLEEAPEVFVPMLVDLVRAGWGEVEIHLHHRNDTGPGLKRKLTRFRDELRQHYGLLGSGADGRPRYAFIHGNWALCNSRPDGDWCGVDEELSILEETGCIADMTFPSIPSPTQPRRYCNCLYLARDVPGRARSHDWGRRCRVGTEPEKGELLMVQGPVALNWRWRKSGVFPRVEHADLHMTNPPTPQRAELWVRQHIHVRNRPEWLFVKLHTHGCIEGNADILLGDDACQLHAFLTTRFNDGGRFRLHYVTAREMANIAFAAMAGESGNAGSYRDYLVAPPPLCEVG